MTTRVRAIYENGVLRPLDKLDLAEGEQVDLTLKSHYRKRVRESIRHMMLEIPDDGEDDIDEEALLSRMDAESKGVTLSDIIIEDREQGW